MQKYAQVSNTVKVFDMPKGSWCKKKRSRISESIGAFYKKYLAPKLKYCFATMRQKSNGKSAKRISVNDERQF